eukprot:142790-Rhodomonas_salina.1
MGENRELEGLEGLEEAAFLHGFDALLIGLELVPQRRQLLPLLLPDLEAVIPPHTRTHARTHAHPSSHRPEQVRERKGRWGRELKGCVGVGIGMQSAKQREPQRVDRVVAAFVRERMIRDVTPVME